ncbi:DsbA family protein [Patescibacteria group bacterium]|nr:DsbA family protein [Patescibacteria group bacterium]
MMLPSRWQKFKNPWVIAGLVLGVLTVAGLVMFFAQVVIFMRAAQRGEQPVFMQNQKSSAVALLSQAPLSESLLAKLDSGGQRPSLGNPQAKVRIVEFCDYECSACKRSALEVRAFMSRHPNDVFLTVRDFPAESIHENAMDAAIAAHCVFEQNADLYWAYHDLLFNNQGNLQPSDLRGYAGSIGANLAKYDTCFRMRAPESAIRSSYADGVALGVQGTPTFFINGIRIPGALDLAALENIFAELKKKL